MSKKPLVIIAGPTAAGKSHLAVRLAKLIGGEIVSSDSMQVYRGMDIGTAKVTEEEMDGVTHHLLDVADPTQPFNVADYKELARTALCQIHGRGHVPILTGGTGFYIQAVLYDVDFPAEDHGDLSFRTRMAELEMQNGQGYLHRRLAEIDPDSAAAIHPNNTQRIIRALEFYEFTKTAISEHNRNQAARTSPYEYAYFVISDNRAVLYERINRRVGAMFKEGLVDEVRELVKNGCTAEMTSMQALGYKEVLPVLEDCDELSGEDVTRLKETIAQDTRHYAKRQITWFKRERDAEWLSFETMSEVQMIERIMSVLKDKGIIDEA